MVLSFSVRLGTPFVSQKKKEAKSKQKTEDEEKKNKAAMSALKKAIEPTKDQDLGTLWKEGTSYITPI